MKNDPRKGEPTARPVKPPRPRKPAGRKPATPLPELAGAILEFVHEAGTLKNTRRTGWQWRGITQCESIADHSWRVVLLSMVIADALVARGEPIDTERVLRMATLHEISEVRIGDIPFPAFAYIGRETKARAEAAAVVDLSAPLAEAGATYAPTFHAFEAADTVEAKIVKAADKLEMMLQASEYEMTGYRGLQDFFDNKRTFAEIETNDLLKALSDALKQRRAAALGQTSVRWLSNGNGGTPDDGKKGRKKGR